MIFGFNTDVKVGSVVYHVQSEARQKDLLLETQVFVRGQCIGKCTHPFPEEPVLVDFAEDIVQESLKAQHRRIVAAVRAGDVEQELGAAFAPLPGKTDAILIANEKSSARSGVPASDMPGLPVPVPAEAATPQTPVAASLQLSALLPDEQKADIEQRLLAALGKLSPASPENAINPEDVSQPLESAAPTQSTEPQNTEPQSTEPLTASAEGLATGSLNIECRDASWLEEEQSLLLILQVQREEAALDCAALTLRIACGQGRPHYAYASTDGNGMAAVAITLEDASGREAKVLVQAESAGESATRRFRLHPAS